jgi:hypothetical protein
MRTGAGGLAGKAVARHRRDDHVERVFDAPAVRGRIGQRGDQLDLLEHRARPTMRYNQRKRFCVPRPDVDEVNVQPIDVGDELRESVQLRFRLSPIVIRRPVARQALHCRKRHTLRLVGDRFLLGPPCRSDPAAQLFDRFLRHMNFWERADRSVATRLPNGSGTDH